MDIITLLDIAHLKYTVVIELFLMTLSHGYITIMTFAVCSSAVLGISQADFLLNLKGNQQVRFNETWFNETSLYLHNLE